MPSKSGLPLSNAAFKAWGVAVFLQSTALAELGEIMTPH